MNSYEIKQAARKARLEERAAGAQDASNTVYKQVRTMASAIPFGQPILIGHHSEGRDRNYRNKISRGYQKSFELSAKSEHYAQKAASVGTGGISSDDPDAIAKLSAELASLQSNQDRMKAANKAIRASTVPEKQIAGLVALGFTESQATGLLTKDFCGRIGFPNYSLTNNNANINRIKKRIAELEQRRTRATVEKVDEDAGFTYREDTEDNRVHIVFPDKPDEATRAVLRSYGFKWSPSRPGKPWVRQLTNAGIYAGRQACAELRKMALDVKTSSAQ
jgi:hypothetical protein